MSSRKLFTCIKNIDGLLNQSLHKGHRVVIQRVSNDKYSVDIFDKAHTHRMLHVEAEKGALSYTNALKWMGGIVVAIPVFLLAYFGYLTFYGMFKKIY